MTIQGLSLFQAMGAKMDYLGQRQKVISQNIANADTPNYRPLDLKPADFSGILSGIRAGGGSGAQVKPVSLSGTDTMHFGTKCGSSTGDAKSVKQRDIYEASPDGNAVVIEEQMINAGETMMDYTLMTNLYQKNINLLRSAVRSR